MADVLKLLSDVLRHNIISQNAFHKRFIGFKSEFYFSAFLKSRGTQTLKGGFLIPVTKDDPAYKKFIYYTVLNLTDEINDYVDVYRCIAKSDCASLALIKYKDSNIDTWATNQFGQLYFPVPVFQYYVFENDRFGLINESILPLYTSFTKTNEAVSLKRVDEQLITDAIDQLRFVSIDELIDLYVSRLIFDVILGHNIIKGVPADIDFIVKGKTGNIFVEVKEKDLAKTIKGFGLDKHRIEGMLEIEKRTGIRYHLVVRQVNNQTQRIFQEWWIISIGDFEKNMCKNAVEGGHGMRSIHSCNPTYICDIKYFRKLE